MAIALTLGINADLSAAVRAYFTKFRILPPRSLAVSQTKVLTGANSFETLLNGILAEKSTTEFVIVTHGHETGNGLFLKLVTRAGAPAGFETTHEMLKLLMDIAGRSPARIDPDEATKLQLQESEIRRLIDLMTKVRDKKLTAVEFRGCNLGRNVTSVERFRAFMGTASFGAPNLHSFFGQFPIGATDNLVRNHAKSHNGETFTYPSSLGGKTCLCCVGVNDHKKPQNGHIIANDTATLDLWIKANFDPANAIGSDRTLPLHGLWELPKIDPNDPLSLPSDPRPIFPLALIADGADKGQNEYKLHVIYRP